jgi:hypothetical protein
MNIEFHYYITHLIAARAGFRGDDLRILAYVSQFTDDNDEVYKIKEGKKVVYTNRISQTLQPIRSRAGRLDVYPLFHFIPGDSNAERAARKDGKANPFNTTPNSANANRIMDAALKTKNLYQIGIAAHAYADTWAHQNFVGYKSGFNKFSGFVDKIIPNIGHADAKTKPDQPRLIWDDERLVHSCVNNKERFLEAAGCLFEKLRTMADSTCSATALKADRVSLLDHLARDIGSDGKEVAAGKERLDGYRERAATPAYGGTEIPDYKATRWRTAAVKRSVRYVGNPAHGRRRKIETFTFKPGYERSDWLNFQNAVFAYAERAKEILCETPALAAHYDG